jgi:hypothetical protein
MTKQIVYVTKYWKTQGILVTKAKIWHVPRLGEYIEVLMTHLEYGKQWNDVFWYKAEEFWLSEEAALEYVMRQLLREIKQAQNQLLALSRIFGAANIEKMLTPLDTLTRGVDLKNLLVEIPQGSVNEEENKNNGKAT